MSDTKVAYISWLFVNIAFCGAVAVACYVTKSGWSLWALFLAPDLRWRAKDKIESACGIKDTTP